MPRIAVLTTVMTCAMAATSTALAGEIIANTESDITIEQAASLLHYSGGNDKLRVEVAPNYSEQLGWSLKGALGGYLTDDIALGLIVEYGENKREYLANAGIQFNDALSLIGTLGMLEEHNEYVEGEGEDIVRQMEYGASLKGVYELGLLSGFELNAYLADAEADGDNVEEGALYGLQLLADLDLTDTTFVKLGGGYEWLRWDEGGADDSLAFSIDATQQLGDVISLNANAKLGASEFVYGGGIGFDLSRDGANTNRLTFSVSDINGYNGVGDDRRVALSWSIGFGAGADSRAEAAGLADATGRIHATADIVAAAPASKLLGDVMKRPSFLPQRVVARAAGSSFCSTIVPYSFVNGAPAGANAVSVTPASSAAIVLIPDVPAGAFDDAVVKIGANIASYFGTFISYRIYLVEGPQGLTVGEPSTVSIVLPSETCTLAVEVVAAVTR